MSSRLATVRATIALLEPRAAAGELFATIALRGWYAELKTLEGGDAPAPEETLDEIITSITSERSTPS